MNINKDTDNEEDYDRYKSNSLNNKLLQLSSFPHSFSPNIFLKIQKEELNNYKCKYCDQIPLCPIVFKNDINPKIICKNCYLRLNENKNLFKDNLIDEEYSNILKQIIGNCIVSCLNSNYNCNWEGHLSQLKIHIDKECKYQPIKCPNKGCNFILLRKELNTHLTQCIYDETLLLIKCRFCQEEIKKKDIETHFEQCPDMLIDCDKNCGNKIKRKSLEDHNFICPENIIKCKYWDFGCKKKIKRKYMDDHEKLEIYNHYNLVNNFFLKNIILENNEYENIFNMINELKNKINDKEKNEKEKLKYIQEEKERKNDYILYQWKEEIKKQKEEEKIFRQNYKKYDDYIPFTGNPIKFIAERENIEKKIFIFKEEKILYSGNYYNNYDQEKHYFAISENNLDLNKITNFSFRINSDPSTKLFPLIAFGLYHIKNEDNNIFNNTHTFPTKGLYTIDLDTNTCYDGKYEENTEKLNINSIITLSYIPNEKLLIIKNDEFEIKFPEIPNNNCNLRLCFIFKGKDRAVIDYNY